MIDYDKMQSKSGLYGVNLSQTQLSQLDKYAELLVDWNNKINLTAITDSQGIMTRHFEDSIALLKYVEIQENASLIDVGTGAGFPGMVLKIVRPDLNVTLLDSLNKRIIFLNEVASQLDIKVNSLHLRAEEGGHMPALREKFDFCCARAVSNLRELAEYCLPYVKPGGKFISMKGPNISDELESARTGIGTLGGKIHSIMQYHISDDSERNIIVVDKVCSTPSQYPRSYAKIKKKPI